MNNFYEDLKKYLEETPEEEIKKVLGKTEKFNNIGPTVQEYVKYLESIINICPHADKDGNSAFEYIGHNHNDDVYKCTLCGKLEYR